MSQYCVTAMERVIAFRMVAAVLILRVLYKIATACHVDAVVAADFS